MKKYIFALSLCALTSSVLAPAIAIAADMMYETMAICSLPRDYGTLRLKLMIDINHACSKSNGPFSGMVVIENASGSKGDFESSAGSALVSFDSSKGTVQFASRFRIDGMSTDINYTLPSSVPAKDVKATYSDISKGKNAPAPSQAEMKCDLIERQYDCRK